MVALWWGGVVCVETPRYQVARVWPDGRLDELNLTQFYEVQSLLALPDNSLVIGGWRSFIIFQGTPTSHEGLLSRVDRDGTLLNNEGGHLVVGQFSLVNGQPQIAAARLDANWISRQSGYGSGACNTP